jgi:hypothetical protein
MAHIPANTAITTMPDATFLRVKIIDFQSMFDSSDIMNSVHAISC